MKRYSHRFNFGAPKDDAKKHRKKGYLQACETGGSLYGEMRTTHGHSGPEEPLAGDELRASYAKLYKKQASAFNKMMRKREE